MDFSTVLSIDPFLILELCLLGLFTGFVAGLFGIGGGMVMVPFIAYFLSSLGIEESLILKLAIATSMSTIVFTSISSVRGHNKKGAVRWELVKRLAPGIVVGSLVSSAGMFAIFKGTTLALIFESFLFFSATQMFINKKPKPTRQLPGTIGVVGAGGVIGFFSGLVGAGGGFISVPFMVWCNIELRNAVGTSAALGFPIALANAIGYVVSGWSVQGRPPMSVGFIWIPGMVLIAVCSVLTAPWGVKVAHKLQVKHLSRIFAALLYVLASSMLYKTVTQLLN
jgi:uncharacterized membrane protein YfcA